jgi:hypothetical protein
MKKKQFRIGRTTPLTPTMLPNLVATDAKKALDVLAPLVVKKHMLPMEALVLAATLMDSYVTGKQRYLTEDEIYGICLIIMKCWEQKLFTLDTAYPYTYAQTHAAWTTGGSEAEA